MAGGFRIGAAIRPCNAGKVSPALCTDWTRAEDPSPLILNARLCNRCSTYRNSDASTKSTNKTEKTYKYVTCTLRF